MEFPREALVYIPMLVVEDPTIPNGDKETIYRLLTLANHTDRCDIDAAGLAGLLGVTPRTMKKRLSRLEERGFITVHDGWVEIDSDLIPNDESVIYGITDSPPEPGGGPGRRTDRDES
jgi:hypothetical protein